MPPNQQEKQQHQEKKQKANNVANTNWDLDRLSTTGRSFLLEPESRTGIVQELQSRLKQEQRRRQELLLLRSANNSLQSPPLESQPQMNKGAQRDDDAPAAAVDQKMQSRNVPSPEDDKVTFTKEPRRMSNGQIDQVAAANTGTVETRRKSLKDEINADQTTSEFGHKKSETADRMAKTDAESAFSDVHPIRKGSNGSLKDYPITAFKVLSADVTADPESEPTVTTSSELNITRQAIEDPAATASKEDSTANVTRFVLNFLRAPKTHEVQAREESTSGIAQTEERDIIPSATTRTDVMTKEARTDIAPASQQTMDPTGPMDSTMGTDVNTLRRNSARLEDQTQTVDEAMPTVFNSASRRNSLNSVPGNEEVTSTAFQNVRRNSLRSASGTGQEALANDIQPARRRFVQGESLVRQAANAEPVSTSQPTHRRSDTGSKGTSPAWSQQPPQSSLPPPQAMPPCLQCLMRCLRDSGLLGSCWKAAVFELEEAFAIKEVADAAVGKNGAGAGGESRQPLPFAKAGGGFVFSGGEGSTVEPPQSEISKWQALEKLCNLRNSMKSCSHVI